MLLVVAKYRSMGLLTSDMLPSSCSGSLSSSETSLSVSCLKCSLTACGCTMVIVKPRIKLWGHDPRLGRNIPCGPPSHDSLGICVSRQDEDTHFLLVSMDGEVVTEDSELTERSLTSRITVVLGSDKEVVMREEEGWFSWLISILLSRPRHPNFLPKFLAQLHTS